MLATLAIWGCPMGFSAGIHNAEKDADLVEKRHGAFKHTGAIWSLADHKRSHQSHTMTNFAYGAAIRIFIIAFGG